jgi:hypothetical protein
MEQIPEVWRDQFASARELDGQGLCVTQRFIFTTGLLTHVSFDGLSYRYAARYCYPSHRDALEALAAWDGQGDPPGPWIKEKLSERSGPGADLERAGGFQGP